ncbi:MAG: SIR2 family protein, partial [Candidatus Lindowbacteria bacterium]|nr:SIR2 family protein [Candidatus Lindowbacteria bacterium]
MKDVDTEIEEVFSHFNELPFLFIGSGMPIRYCSLESWETLLRYFAELSMPGNSLAFEFYRNEVKTGNDKTFFPAIASRIELDFNRIWLKEPAYAKERDLYADLVKSNISPFKIAIANHVTTRYKRSSDPHLLNELSCLKNAAKRSTAGVITTTYHRLAEDLFEEYQVFVGQEELLFSATQGVAEIYKIHGCCQHPASIVISQNDYETFEARNAYLAAKLLTIFIEHPIVFMGYSLTDPNIIAILKEIVGCLSQENLSKLQRRMVFIEYSEKTLSRSDVRGYSLSFEESGRTLEMTRIILYDYLPLYRTLLSKRYQYSPKLLRQLKRDLYQLVATNKPVDSFHIIDIENDADLDKVSVLAGVGVSGQLGDTASIGHNIPEAEDLYRDIIFDDGGFDIKTLIESAFITLLKGHSKSLPIHKYLQAYRRNFKNEPPVSLTAQAPKNFAEYFSKDLKK